MVNGRRRGDVDQVESFEISGKISKLTLYAARSSACQTKDTSIFSINWGMASATEVYQCIVYQEFKS